MKHISCVDNLCNLQALIRHELRELGVKVPKAKKLKRGGGQKNQEVHKGQIFGNYLAHVHCVHVPDCGYVAKFLVDAAEIILENIDNEGVFRKSGAVSRQKEIKQQLENGTGFVGANVHDVTALVKQFFRELPEPLFTSTYHDTFVRCHQIEDKELSTRAILLLCLLLPAEHISTLQFTLRLLAKITQHAEKNKMDSTNLAVVIAPNIMHVNSKTETMKSCEERLLQVQTSVVELLIEHAEEVGMIDEQMAEKTAFMSEVFSTDDELDASEDNLDDTKENRKKEKKRKRSGSFQGFVSSIAQSITKWRKSTDGKTNTSGFSQGSNMSHVSVGHTRSHPEQSDDGQVYQFTATEATPVVRRKKPTHLAEGKAFSASKKKAILNQLPQGATLASTPFTPATGVKRMDLNGVKRGVHDTPSMPPRPYMTPRHSMKTPRKKLTLFSPASTTKKKRYSSTTNLSLNSAGKKTGKSKGIFRRLSGSKGDQAFPVQKAVSHNQIGHRLATSPTSTISVTSVQSSTSGKQPTSKNLKDDSPIAAIAQNSFSASMCEQSIISTYDEESRSLNEGFIMNEEKDGDITRIMSEPAIAGSHDPGEYVMLDDVFARESVSDSTFLSSRSNETPKGHSRSFSVDSTLDGSTRKSSLRRGGPNSIKVGLLQGDHSEVNKLRRSFGLDKSEIGYPIPVSVANVEDDNNYIQLDNSFDLLNTQPRTERAVNDGVNSGETCNNSPGSVSECKSTVSSTTSLTSNGAKNKEDGYECDNESEAGFSTVSGGTAIFKPKMCLQTKLNEESKENSDVNDEIRKTLAQQKQESKDSLLSEASSTMSPIMMFKERELTRSISADSGKGSMYEEQREECGNATLDSISSSLIDKDSPMVTSKPTEILSQVDSEVQMEVDTVDPTETKLDLKVSDVEASKPTLVHQKSVSSQDLIRDEKTPTRVSRSKSLLETSISARKSNAKPNLQISAETHKLLARAGYIKEQKEDFQMESDDFIVPASFPFIKQAETLNPRRESIIALQKNNAGKVKSNVKQFDRIISSGVKTEIESRHASPFRFPNSTTRKRGTTRLKIPSAFNRTDLENSMNVSIDYFNTSKDKMSAGTAVLPISTQMIKPSDPDFNLNEGAENQKCGLKRKPSIYHAEKGGIVPPLNKSRNISGSLNTTIESLECEENNMSCDKLNDAVFTNDVKGKSSFLGGVSINLDQSLQDTNDVCTPRCEKQQLKLDKENDAQSSFNKMPDLKQTLLSTPISLDTIAYRTASNKTPMEIFKTVQSPRSPIKPLKRLGSSPHSPRGKVMRSPKTVKSNRRSLLTTIAQQNEDFENL
ncbi:rho GTPase-activating protein gacU-like isoform X2 [Ruditapes philippinarum]|uniref:rho GTPase-activating protein gacU-like isoform X2 n=1 Tax=Ruditapes philippinarum TaxID=129788 RepID=UPI00295B9331|nr:rho GTPase-activating protein gacU-like isoform X2 [Ruditapes philippinarum]